MHELLQSIAILVNLVVVLLLVLRNVAESALRRRHLKPGAPGESNVSLAGMFMPKGGWASDVDISEVAKLHVPKGPAPGAKMMPPPRSKVPPPPPPVAGGRRDDEVRCTEPKGPAPEAVPPPEAWVPGRDGFVHVPQLGHMNVPPPTKRPEDELCTEPCCNAASWD